MVGRESRGMRILLRKVYDRHSPLAGDLLLIDGTIWDAAERVHDGTTGGRVPGGGKRKRVMSPPSYPACSVPSHESIMRVWAPTGRV